MGATAIVGMIATASTASAFDNITSQLNLGSSGTNVTRLQTFFAANPNIYPQGLVTGYFGALTRAAVLKFQAVYNLEQVGRVGPLTLAKINSLINAGGWGSNTSSDDIYAPIISEVTQTTPTSSNVKFTLKTNELSSVRVAYSTTPLTFKEEDENGSGFSVLGGTSTNSSNGTATNHEVNLTNLTPNTNYYYTIIATDLNGNIQLWGVNNTFKTNQ